MSAIHWFEIPAADIQRAAAFYGKVLASEVRVLDLREQMGSWIGTLPNNGGVGGHLVQNEQYGYVPSQAGTLVYLVVQGDLNDALARVEQAGGQIVMPKTQLGADQDGGYVAWMIDSEGNRVGLFSAQ